MKAAVLTSGSNLLDSLQKLPDERTSYDQSTTFRGNMFAPAADAAGGVPALRARTSWRVPLCGFQPPERPRTSLKS